MGGRRMTRRRGRMWMKTLLIHGAMVWVCGDRKCMLSTTTVTQMLLVGVRGAGPN